jgi:hypothetical protein
MGFFGGRREEGRVIDSPNSQPVLVYTESQLELRVKPVALRLLNGAQGVSLPVKPRRFFVLVGVQI